MEKINQRRGTSFSSSTSCTVQQHDSRATESSAFTTTIVKGANRAVSKGAQSKGMLISVCQQNEIYKIYYMMYDKKKLFKKLLELLDDEIISKQTSTVNGVAQDFPVSSVEVYITDVGANLKMRILLKEDAAKYLIEGNEDVTAADGVGDDAPVSKNNLSHYSKSHSSLRSAIIQCANGLIIVECCSTKPSVMGISAAIQEAWPDQADQADHQASALVAPALILVAAGATGGKDAAVAVHFFDQGRDRRSLMNDFICFASANKSSLSSISISTSNVESESESESESEREMMCVSDQDGGGSARSLCTLLLTFVRTSEETSLEGMTKVVTKLPNVGGDCCGSSSSSARAEDSYSHSQQVRVLLIEDDVFLSGNLAAAKESPLGCHDDASFLTNRIKERVVMVMVSSFFVFFLKAGTYLDSRLDSDLDQKTL